MCTQERKKRRVRYRLQLTLWKRCCKYNNLIDVYNFHAYTNRNYCGMLSNDESGGGVRVVSRE